MHVPRARDSCTCPTLREYRLSDTCTIRRRRRRTRKPVYAHLYHTGGTVTDQLDLQISKISTKRNRTDLACQCGPAIEPYLLSPRNKLPVRPCCSASITPSETLVCQCGLARALCRYRQSRALPAPFTLVNPEPY